LRHALKTFPAASLRMQPIEAAATAKGGWERDGENNEDHH